MFDSERTRADMSLETANRRSTYRGNLKLELLEDRKLMTIDITLDALSLRSFCEENRSDDITLKRSGTNTLVHMRST